MRLKELANQYDITLESLQNLIHDFDIDLNFCFDNSFEVKDQFVRFVEKHLDFIKRYAQDKSEMKNIEQIAKIIQVDKSKIEEFFVQNGVPQEELANIKTNISSFQIHAMLGGNYDFINADIPEKTYKTDDLVGYSDLFFYQADLLDPFINEEQIHMWGISKSAGIILYGPPGSGKIYWGKRIANLIGYEFVHVYKDYLLNSKKTNTAQFNSFLREKMNTPKTLLFIEKFDDLVGKNTNFTDSPESLELMNTIIRFIQKDSDKELLMVGSVEELSSLDDEITAPGRFDLHIPIFLPSFEERSQLIYYHLTHQLSEDSPLLAILRHNKADNVEFWIPVANEMKLFSNTMIVDFTQSLKKRLYSLYRRNGKLDMQLSLPMIMASLNEGRSKMNQSYMDKVRKFFIEAKRNNEYEFPRRFLEMQHELESFVKKEEPIRKIGFETKNEKKENS